MLVTDHNFKTNGQIQDVEKILSTVPSQYHDIFQKGYGGKVNYGKVQKVTPSSNPTPVIQSANNQMPKINAKKGDTVSHKTFGTGKIKNISGSTLVVTFGHEDKTFQYPMAFTKGFLTLMK